MSLSRGRMPANFGIDQKALTACDQEPIHRPDAIQPHGLLLVAGAGDLLVRAAAGDVEGRLTLDWLQAPLHDVLGLPEETLRQACKTASGGAPVVTLPACRGVRESFEIVLRASGDQILAELEPSVARSASPLALLSELDQVSEQFELAPDVASLGMLAAAAFRRLTGFDRVMIYRFLDDGSGEVLAEDLSGALPGLLNHRFPSTDLPVQARALYVRNRIRIIPDVTYTPAPLRPDQAGLSGLDMSDLVLRSVSPIHLQYLRNMDVGASASISIVLDGMLWGLVACHHATPHQMPEDTRAACRTLVGIMSRQLRAKEEVATYQERLRLRNAMDMLQARIDPELSLPDAIRMLMPDLSALFPSHGFAIVQGREMRRSGVCLDTDDLRTLATWAETQAEAGVYSSAHLARSYPEALNFADRAAGLLVICLSLPEPVVLIWTRAELVETIEWAGNPHGKTPSNPNEILQPRTSFETWRETVRFRSARWNNEQIQTARRLRRVLMDAHQSALLRDLNTSLGASLSEREKLLRQKDFLIREVNHRVQNSLQLVTSFLKLQSRSTNNEETGASLAEARRRIAAIGLVHRRLYRDETFGVIELARYLEELCHELCGSLGEDWARQMTLSLTPALISADRAINIGLVVTELVINASKYAYDGQAGPLHVTLSQHDDRLSIAVADRGRHVTDPHSGGFGLRMMNAVIASLSGVLQYDRLQPGLRAVITLPVETIHDAEERGLPQ